METERDNNKQEIQQDNLHHIRITGAQQALPSAILAISHIITRETSLRPVIPDKVALNLALKLQVRTGHLPAVTSLEVRVSYNAVEKLLLTGKVKAWT